MKHPNNLWPKSRAKRSNAVRWWAVIAWKNSCWLYLCFVPEKLFLTLTFRLFLKKNYASNVWTWLDRNERRERSGFVKMCWKYFPTQREIHITSSSRSFLFSLFAFTMKKKRKFWIKRWIRSLFWFERVSSFQS